MIISLKTVALSFLILNATSTLTHAQSIIFVAQENPSQWLINGEQIANRSEILSEPLTTVALGGDRCHLSEDGFNYFPVTIGFMVPKRGFAGTETGLADLGATLEVNVVFTALEDKDYIIDLDFGFDTPFSVGRHHREELEDLSLDNARTADEYVAGLVHAIFLAEYYKRLLDLLPLNNDTVFWEARKVRYAGIAVDLLGQQHRQTGVGNSFSLDPIVLPEGTAYELLKLSLVDRSRSLKTLIETRFRTFWYVRDRLESDDLRGRSVRELPEGVLRAARQISTCLLDTTRDLRTIDRDLYEFLIENNFYVPGLGDDLLTYKEDGTFNLWRDLYLRDNPDGVLDEAMPRDQVIERIFNR